MSTQVIDLLNQTIRNLNRMNLQTRERAERALEAAEKRYTEAEAEGKPHIFKPRYNAGYKDYK